MPDYSAVTRAACEFTAPFEGNSLWPYLDGAGNPTIGVGHLLYSDLYAQTLFPGVAVADFAEQWDALRACAPDKSLAFYETATDLRITIQQSLDLFLSDMDCKVNACQRKITGFAALPLRAQMVCVDLEYNTGNVLLFKHFLADLADSDWAGAAGACHRIETPAPGGVQPDRNTACMALLRGLIPGVTT